MLISLSFDDGAIYDRQVIELLRKHDLKATFYIPADWESFATRKGWKPLTKADVLELSEEFEIGSHTISHPLLTRIPYGAAEYEITMSKVMLEDLLGKPVTRFCYPRGYATDPIKDIVRKHYSYARSTLVGNVRIPEDPVWENTSVHAGCDRREYNQEHWFDYGIRHLEQAKSKRNGYFHLWAHSWELENNNAWDSLDRMFAEIKKVENEN